MLTLMLHLNYTLLNMLLICLPYLTSNQAAIEAKCIGTILIRISKDLLVCEVLVDYGDQFQ